MDYDFASMPCYGVKARWSLAALAVFYDRFFKTCGITGRQYTYLYTISINEGCSTSELAEIIKVDRSTMTRNLRTLMNRGLVVDLKAPDERNSKLSLTEEGKLVTAKAVRQWNKAQDCMKERFGEQELAVIDRVLEEIGSLGNYKI